MTNGTQAPYVSPLPNWWTSLTAQQLVVDLPGLQQFITANFYAQIRDLTATPPTTPATVIDVDDAFVIDIHLDLTVPSPLQYLLCGYWCISVCLESMCGDTDYRFPQDATSPPGYCCVLLPFNCDSPSGTSYDTYIYVSGGIVQESECGSPYEGTVIVTLLSQCKRTNQQNGDPNDPGTYIPAGAAGSLELPLLTFYNDQ